MTFSTLTSSKKNYFVHHADNGNTWKQTGIIGGASTAGRISLLLIFGGVVFVFVLCDY